MKEIDWSKAPEGATHFRHDDPQCSWRMLKDGVWHAWFGGKWMTVTGSAEHLYVERPTWTGEGRPTVGTVCEAWYDDGRVCWHQADVVGHNPYEPNTIAVSLKGDHERKLIWSDHFRPLRTPEQIAAEERRAAILDMKGHLSFSDYREAEQHCAALYDAGYRKVTP